MELKGEAVREIGGKNMPASGGDEEATKRGTEAAEDGKLEEWEVDYN